MTETQTTTTDTTTQAATAGSLEALRFRLGGILKEIEAVPGDVSTQLHTAKAAVELAVTYVESHFSEAKEAVKSEIAAVDANINEPMTSSDAAAATAAVSTAQ